VPHSGVCDTSLVVMRSDPQHAPYHLPCLAIIRRQPYPRKRIVEQFFAKFLSVLFEQLAHDRFGEFGVALEREHANGRQTDVQRVRFEILCGGRLRGVEHHHALGDRVVGRTEEVCVGRGRRDAADVELLEMLPTTWMSE
jgi:hypothetical protein